MLSGASHGPLERAAGSGDNKGETARCTSQDRAGLRRPSAHHSCIAWVNKWGLLSAEKLAPCAASAMDFSANAIAEWRFKSESPLKSCFSSCSFEELDICSAVKLHRSGTDKRCIFGHLSAGSEQQNEARNVSVTGILQGVEGVLQLSQTVSDSERLPGPLSSM